MRSDIVERLKQGKLLESDVSALLEALTRGEVVASGAGAVAADGDIVNSHVTTFVFQGTKIELSEALLDKFNEAVRRSLPPVLHNLPPVAPAFTGRGREEEEIVAALVGLGGSAAISALKGIGGVGKTALAVKIGHRLTVQFPDAQLLLDLRGTRDAPMSPRAAMESVIRRFHPEGQLPDDDAAVLEIYRDLLRHKRAFLILDNARDTAQVQRLLPPAPSAAIVTSRQVLHLADARSIRLDDLPLSDAMALVLKLLDGERSLSDLELRKLAQDCCVCHPLSLRVAALFLKAHKGRGLSDYIAGVEKDRARLRLRRLPDHDVLAVIGQSVKQLQAEDEALCANWRDLSVFPSGFDTAAAAAVWAIAGGDAGSDRLCELEERGLIEPIAEDRYRLHDLLRDMARQDRPEQGVAAARRHAEYFISVLERADTLYLRGGAAIADALSLFDRERTNIETGQRWAAAATWSEDAARLAGAYANAGVYVLNLRLHSREWIRWSEAALVGCRKTGDRHGEGNALGNLGLAYAALGEIRSSIQYHEKALAILREIDDRRGEGASLGNLGNTYTQLGETRKAIPYYEQQLTIVREIGDRRGEGNALGNLGLAYRHLGETRNAIGRYEQQLTITREIGDRRGEGNALGNLGNAYADLGERRKAIEYHEKALAISREIGDRRAEGQDLGNLGGAYADLGESRKAIEYHEQYLTIARETGDRRGEGNALGNLGITYARLGETRKAIGYHEKALAISREIGDRRAEGRDLRNLGTAYADLGETRKAIEHYEQRMIIAREIGDRRGEGNALGNLGNAYADLGETRTAVDHYEQQLTIAREIGDRRGDGNGHANLGLALKDSDPETARAHWQAALAIFTAMEDPNTVRVAQWLAELDGKHS